MNEHQANYASYVLFREYGENVFNRPDAAQLVARRGLELASQGKLLNMTDEALFMATDNQHGSVGFGGIGSSLKKIAKKAAGVVKGAVETVVDVNKQIIKGATGLVTLPAELTKKAADKILPSSVADIIGKGADVWTDAHKIGMPVAAGFITGGPGGAISAGVEQAFKAYQKKESKEYAEQVAKLNVAEKAELRRLQKEYDAMLAQGVDSSGVPNSLQNYMPYMLAGGGLLLLLLLTRPK